MIYQCVHTCETVYKTWFRFTKCSLEHLCLWNKLLNYENAWKFYDGLKTHIYALKWNFWRFQKYLQKKKMFWDLGFMLGYFSWCSGSTTWGAGTLAPLALDSTFVEDVVLLVVYYNVSVVFRARAARMNVPRTVSATGARALAMC